MYPHDHCLAQNDNAGTPVIRHSIQGSTGGTPDGRGEDPCHVVIRTAAGEGAQDYAMRETSQGHEADASAGARLVCGST